MLEASSLLLLQLQLYRCSRSFSPTVGRQPRMCSYVLEETTINMKGDDGGGGMEGWRADDGGGMMEGG